MKIRRALISVSDKTSLADLAEVLCGGGVELIASGGTAKFLLENNFSVTPVEEVTGNPEAFGGRLKTLSFELAGALLYRRDHPGDRDEAGKLGINRLICSSAICTRSFDWPGRAGDGRNWWKISISAGSPSSAPVPRIILLLRY